MSTTAQNSLIRALTAERDALRAENAVLREALTGLEAAAQTLSLSDANYPRAEMPQMLANAWANLNLAMVAATNALASTPLSAKAQIEAATVCDAYETLDEAQ